MTEFDGMNARIFQHETDHQEGLLFTKYIKSSIMMKNARRKQRLLIRREKNSQK